MSSTGRYVTYVSNGKDIAGGYAESGPGVYVKDMATGDVKRIDSSYDNGPINGAAMSARISGDGRFVVYLSTASNLLPGGVDNNGGADVFIYDQVTHETKLVTRGVDGTSAEGIFRDVVISANGRYVAYIAETTDIPLDGYPDTNTAAYSSNVYVFDRVTGKTINLTPLINDGVQINRLHSIDDSGVPYYDAGIWRNVDGGRQVQAWNFQGGNHTHVASVAAGGHFLKTADGAYSVWVVPSSDRSMAQKFWIKGTGGELKDDRGNTTSFIGEVALAANGRFVIYTSNFDVVHQADTEGLSLYLWDMETNAVVRLATAPSGQPIGGIQISADGHWITFNSYAALTEDDTNNQSDVFRVVNPFGAFGNGAEGDFPDGDHWIVGTDDDDNLLGTDGNDHISALRGNDIVSGYNGNDRIEGHDGNDIIYGGDGFDVLKGGDGDDTIFGDGVPNAPDLEGSLPEDDGDLINGGDGNDVICGNGGNDTIKGGTGRDEIWGGDGDDQIRGGLNVDEPDYVDGGKGNDLIFGDEGKIEVGGRDLLFGGLGDDTILGDGGDDLINGGEDTDELWGGDGNDTILGGVNASGKDKLYGGHGNDVLGGGAGADDFVFSGIAVNGHDHITDFQHGVDRLVFSGADYGFAAGHLLTSAEFTLGAAAVGASAQFVWDAANGKLYFDADGNGAGEAFELALISHGATVTKEDLFFT